MYATLSSLYSSRMTISPSRRESTSRSPSDSNFCLTRSMASSSRSADTGRLCNARLKPTRNFASSNSSRKPFDFTICGRRNSACSYVAKRLSHDRQRRRRRILSPSSLTRESTTCVSGCLQKGHFMKAAAGGYWLSLCSRVSLDRSFPVNRKLLAQLHHCAACPVDIGFIVRRFQHVGDQIRKFL